MKADKSKMFPVSLRSLKAEDGAPFPLYVWLKKNDRFIPVRMPGDPIGSAQYEALLQREYEELWVPVGFQEAFEAYAKYLEQSGAVVKDASQAIAETKAETKSEAEAPAGASVADDSTSAEPPSPEALAVREVFANDQLDLEQKAKALADVSQDLLRALNQITTRGEPARADGLKRCKQIADEILILASQSSNIYDEIKALRDSQEDIEHSVITGTIAVMFGLALGFTDEQLLADITVAAIFHDIGMVRVDSEVMAKHESEWSLAERKKYELHVGGSVDILKESGTEFHPRVFRMIMEHHENYDGSGFPKGLRGAEIDETSQILHLANLFDRLCTGKQTGQELAPSEAFDYIYDLVQTPGAVQEVQPELVERVFQFMLSEKAAAEDVQQEAEARVQAVMEKQK